MTFLTVTDHAVLRYLERIAGAPVEALRLSLAAGLDRASLAARAAGLPDRHVIRTHEADFVVQDGTVLTVLEPRSNPAAVLGEAERTAEIVKRLGLGGRG